MMMTTLRDFLWRHRDRIFQHSHLGTVDVQTLTNYYSVYLEAGVVEGEGKAFFTRANGGVHHAPYISVVAAEEYGEQAA